MRISLAVLKQIRHTIGALPPEHGGVLGGYPKSGVVTEFFFDRSARRTTATYSPDDQFLNRLFKKEWNPRGIRVMGFVHSHPGLRQPSGGDISYSRRILDSIDDLDRLLIPIVISAAEGGRFEIHPFAVGRNREALDAVPLSMTVLDDKGQRVVDWEYEMGQRVRELPVPALGPAVVEVGHGAAVGRPDVGGAPVPEAFRRVTGAYDLELLKRSRVIYVGTGGAAGFIEDLARAGVGQHVLIDPDVVNETNLGTQQTYRRDLGRRKVEAIAERICDINPDSFILALGRTLDGIDDREFEFLATGRTNRWSVSQTLVCGLTDNFDAQARVNRLALQFRLPSLCAQVYKEGRGAEVTFTHPETTPACHRCALSSRYKAHVDGGYNNDVTSDGTPIFATTRLNALKGFIAMALLHHGTSHPRWGGLLNRIGNRNLVQVRMDPDLATTIGLGLFDRVLGGVNGERVLFDETLWLPQQPDGSATGYPTCPDCGGTGNLKESAGTFHDTRAMRKKGERDVAVHVRLR
jgi:proteasome lid subunit RPN8/RPN11